MTGNDAQLRKRSQHTQSRDDGGDEDILDAEDEYEDDDIGSLFVSL